MKEQIRQLVSDNSERLWLFFGFILVGGLCFEAGVLQGAGRQEPLVLSLPAAPLEQASAAAAEPERQPGLSAKTVPVAARMETQESCAFVGSRNSNKYHLPSCPAAKRIKAENRVCFSSKEDAEKRGYLPSCIK